MDEPGPADAPLLPPMGRLSREAALDLLARADELLAAGEFAKAAAYYQRVVGFDDSAVTAAALLGLGEARYRMDDEDGAVQTWKAVLELGETPSTYPVWRNLAAAYVRAGELGPGDARLPRGGPAGTRGGQGGDRVAARLAGQGDRRHRRGEEVLRARPRRRSADPVLHDHHRRHGRSCRSRSCSPPRART